MCGSLSCSVIVSETSYSYLSRRGSLPDIGSGVPLSVAIWPKDHDRTSKSMAV